MKPQRTAQLRKYGFGEMGTRINQGYRIRSIRQADNCGPAQMRSCSSAFLRKGALLQNNNAATIHLGKSSLG
jgi:hypothetical protein